MEAIGAGSTGTRRHTRPAKSHYLREGLSCIAAESDRSRGIIRCMETRIPDFGDVVGLTRRYTQTIDIIRSIDIAESDKRTLIAEIEAQDKVAQAATTVIPNSICFNVATICSTEGRYFFTANSLPL
jgi:hypothetical protein